MSTGILVDNDDIVRGCAVADATDVVRTADDLTAASPTATQSIDVVGFVPERSVPGKEMAMAKQRVTNAVFTSLSEAVRSARERRINRGKRSAPRA